jgi:hypothetical protein
MKSIVNNSLLILALASSNVWAGCASKTATSVEGDVVVSTNTVIVCANGQADIPVKRIVQIGDEVFENELLKVSKQSRVYFEYKNMRCRMFEERYVLNEKLRISNGVICHLDENSEFWQVVDKW